MLMASFYEEVFDHDRKFHCLHFSKIYGKQLVRKIRVTGKQKPWIARLERHQNSHPIDLHEWPVHRAYFLYIGDEQLPSYMGIITSHCKDPVMHQSGFNGMSCQGCCCRCSPFLFQQRVVVKKTT